jgi:acid phosphatase type 7
MHCHSINFASVIGLLMIRFFFFAPAAISQAVRHEDQAGASKPTPQTAGPTKPAFLVRPYIQLPTTDSMTIMWETSVKLPSRVEFSMTAKLDRVVEAKTPVTLHEIPLRGLEPGTSYCYRVRSGDLVSETYSFKTAPLAGTKRWRMAVYGDSRSNPAMHHKIAEQIAKARVDLIVHTGDIVLNGKNHDSWRTEFFEPLSPLAHSTPWVSTIGNHERDSEHYFSYMALPGNERYFGFDYANAHIICLDSNGWIERGRDSPQFQWLQAHLKEKRSADWTFVAFHHPLFSAHASRPINSLRWDWAPLLLDRANRIDGVLTGHDHFYARNFRMGRLEEHPQTGVLFLTSAGGGASLYPTKMRDYIAKTVRAHHFTLFDFDGSRVSLTAIDSEGAVIDRFVLTKDPTPPDEYCAYEIEELRQFLRLALSSAPTIPMRGRGESKIDTALEVPTRFRVEIKGRLIGETGKGWRWKQPEIPFEIRPGEPLHIPFQAEMDSGDQTHTPAMTIELEPRRFRNRTVKFYPLKLAGPQQVVAQRLAKGPSIDGHLSEEVWSLLKGNPEAASAYSLLGLPPRGGRKDRVGFLADEECLYFGGRFADEAHAVQVKADEPTRDAGQLALFGEHVRVILSDGKATRIFAVTPEQTRFSAGEKKGEPSFQWQARAGRDKEAWTVEMAIPMSLFSARRDLRVNVVRREKFGRTFNDYELCPTYGTGDNPDLIPDWRPVEKIDRFARLIIK